MGRARAVATAAVGELDAQHRFVMAAARFAEAKQELVDLRNYQPKDCQKKARRPDDPQTSDPADYFKSHHVDGHPCWDQGFDPGGPEQDAAPRPWWHPLEVARRPNYCAPCLEAVTVWTRRNRLSRAMGGHVRGMLKAFAAWRAPR